MSDYSIDSSKATDWREGRRLRAFELKQEGWSQQDIARALGVGKSAVSQWMKRARQEGGKEALRKRSSPGATSPLSPDQWDRLPGTGWKRGPHHVGSGERCGHLRGWPK